MTISPLISTVGLVGELVVFAVLMRRYFAMPLHAAPVAFVSGVIVVLYAADFLGVLQLTSWLVHAVALVAGAWMLARPLVGRGPNLVGDVRPLQVAATYGPFMAIMIGLYFLTRSGEYKQWDEFSHWGSVIRSLCFGDTFHYLRGCPLYHQDSPPGIALFSYHFLRLTGYSEAGAILSYDFAIVSFLAVVVGAAFRSNFLLGCLCIPAFYAGVTILGNGWENVLIDHVLSVAFAAAIAFYREQAFGARSWFWVPVVLAALTLLKQAGYSLALLSAILIVTDAILVVFFRRLVKSAGEREGWLNWVSGHRALAAWALSVLLVPIATNWTWNAHVESAHLRRGWSTYGAGEGLRLLTRDLAPGRELDVGRLYFRRLFGVEAASAATGSLIDVALDTAGRAPVANLWWSSRAQPVAAVLLQLALGGILVLFLARGVEARARFGLLWAGLLAGAMVYFAALATAYILHFSEYEARELISFQRYHNVYLLGLAILLVYAFAVTLADLRRVLRWVVVLAVAGALHWQLRDNYETLRLFLDRGAEGASDLRRQVKGQAEQLLPRLGLNDKVYIYWQGSHGLEFWFMKHELLPRVTNLFAFTVVLDDEPATIPEDIRLTRTQFEASLAEYNYVVVGSSLEAFRRKFSPLVAEEVPADARLLRVMREGSGLRLVAVRPEEPMPAR